MTTRVKLWILALPLAALPIVTFAHPLEGKWNVQKTVCYPEAHEGECTFTPPTSLEVSIETDNSLEKFCLNKFDGNGFTKECFFSQSWKTDRASYYAKLWISDSLNWYSDLRGHDFREFRRADLVVGDTGQMEFWELYDSQDDLEKPGKFLQIQYSLVRAP